MIFEGFRALETVGVPSAVAISGFIALTGLVATYLIRRLQRSALDLPAHVEPSTVTEDQEIELRSVADEIAESPLTQLVETVVFPPVSTDISPPPTKKPWISYQGLSINARFFKRGLILVSSGGEALAHPAIKTDYFSINERDFYLIDPSTSPDNPKADKSSLKNTRILLEQLTVFSIDHGSPIKTFGDKVVLFNKRHREEIFLPVVLSSGTERPGLYLYPWISKRKHPFGFSGFNQFVTAGCLFGANLEGVDQDGNHFSLINHHLRLKPGQRIDKIYYDEDVASPYEQLLFAEMGKQCVLIDTLAKAERPKRLLFHLPAYDYILFGIQLYINNKLSYEALDSFIKLIFIKRNLYKKTIGAICGEHAIDVSFASPFDNLFGTLIFEEGITETILTKICITESDHDMESYKYEQVEEDVVAKCLTQLLTNEHDTELRSIWQDFIKLNAGVPSKTIESLFKIANTIMVAKATRKNDDYETCSLLPLSEKQIQVNYDSYSKKQMKSHDTEFNHHYPAVVNITTFEPLLAYSETTNGLLFYFSVFQKALSSLIVDKKILEHANNNVGRFFGKKLREETGDTHTPSVKIGEILGETPRPPPM